MANIVTSGLTAYWNALQNVTPTTWSDLSGNNYNLTFSGSGSHSVGSNGVAFNGTNDEAKITGITGLSLSAYTLEVWVQTQVAPSTTFMPALDVAQDTTNAIDLFLYNGRGEAQQKVNNVNQVGNAAVTYSNMNYIALTRDASGASVLYINNGNPISGSFTASVFNIANIGLGAGIVTATKSYFNGNIASARLYNRALTSAEKAQNYSVGTAVGLPSGGTTVTSTVSATGQGTVSDTTYLIIPSTIAATGTGAVSTTSNLILPPSSVSATGEGDVTTSTSLITTVTSSVAAVGVGTASVSPNVILSSTVSAVGQGVVSIVDDKVVTSTVSATGVGTVSTSPNLVLTSTVSAIGEGDVTVSTSGSSIVVASVSASGVGTASTSSQLVVSSSISAIGAGVATVSDGVIVTSAVRVNGVGTVVIMNRIVGDTINLLGEVDTTLILLGESDTMVVLLGEVDTTVVLRGESDTTPNLSGQQNTFVTLGGEI